MNSNIIHDDDAYIMLTYCMTINPRMMLDDMFKPWVFSHWCNSSTNNLTQKLIKWFEVDDVWWCLSYVDEHSMTTLEVSYADLNNICRWHLQQFELDDDNTLTMYNCWYSIMMMWCCTFDAYSDEHQDAYLLMMMTCWWWWDELIDDEHIDQRLTSRVMSRDWWAENVEQQIHDNQRLASSVQVESCTWGFDSSNPS